MEDRFARILIQFMELLKHRNYQAVDLSACAESEIIHMIHIVVRMAWFKIHNLPSAFCLMYLHFTEIFYRVKWEENIFHRQPGLLLLGCYNLMQIILEQQD